MSTLILKNKFSKQDYEIIETYETGISLLGWETKSLRAKNAKLENAFCTISSRRNEIYLHNCYIAQYMNVKCETSRTRKLLMHKYEILRIKNKVDQLSLIIIPISLYWKNNHIKLEIALAKRLKKHDKREKIKELEAKRQMKSLIY
ncbi:SsrA-binding protein [Metamycoplasma cloacale]|uniref:SsrA-binding protein n=1 Tax=Metamycoplasma cloacale TaxID=92401 RepID=A0A2Z4LN24_9BACT|nr:SsrA-binding protein SmpB [Metamycoplasma cloacale]AWX42818.1 SsrA-binding protein SmpB [Metamycoplasma cloacale]VEU79363.1 SsrA-binding protein [Metamycoplasma cloacale]